MKNWVFYIVFGAILASCAKDKGVPTLKTGTWHATIGIQGKALPFGLEVVNDASGGYDFYIRNAEEKLLLDEVTVTGDSVNIALHVFDANIKAKINDDGLEGAFIKNYDPSYKYPFNATFGYAPRFGKNAAPSTPPDFTGKYDVIFRHDQDTTISVGIFKQDGDSVTGTFLTITGDYRYLEGNVIGDTLHLSAFDGNHAYIFTGVKNTDGTLSGDYYSGKASHETWTAVKNDQAALPDAEKLTYLKPGFDKIEFSFPDVNGKKISLADEKYKNKVVILQISGSWCPNCMDETKFLAPWYIENKSRGVEIIGLAYERKPEFEYARDRVNKMVNKFKIPYDYVIAGVNDKSKAAETLPMLNTVIAFPTTIFIGKDGSVKKIHTGFSGPGTGIYYQQFIDAFNKTVDELVNERTKKPS